MICPFCSSEMQHGEIVCDARSAMYFHREGVKRTIGDMLCGIGRIMTAEGSWWKQRLPADYCTQCKKMIFDTEIAK